MVNITALGEFVASGQAAVDLAGETSIPTVVVEWDRAEGAFWTLRLCERFGVATAQWEYPPAAAWVADGEKGMEYGDHPVSSDASIQGRSSSRVAVNGDELSFEVSLHNDSPAVWTDAWCWVCLIHLWAGSFQANCELPVGMEEDPWRPCASLVAPKERWLKWCPTRERREVSERIAQHHARMWQPHIEAVRGAVRAWRIVAQRSTQQFIELSSRDAIILGWSHWPCTDMGLYFGSLEPGSSATVHGKLRFSETPYEPI